VPVWGTYNTGQYVATIAFSYICFAMLILFCFALVAFQGAVSDELGICELEARRLGQRALLHCNLPQCRCPDPPCLGPPCVPATACQDSGNELAAAGG
jgi:hypothetical protein